jgi:peroxidase
LHFTSLLKGTLVDSAQAFGSHVNSYMNDHYYEVNSNARRGQREPSVRYSLPAININRGRDHGIPGYNYYRALCGLNYAKSFDDLWNVPIESRQRLASVYEHVNDVDLFTGGTSEFPIIGGAVGPTFACKFVQFFSI